MDAVRLWHLLQKQQRSAQRSAPSMPQLLLQTPSPNRLHSARQKMQEAAARLREAQMEMEEANEAERLARLTEHSPELLTSYSQRIQELERENRELRCSLLKDTSIETADSLPLPTFRAGHFQINGSDDEGEDKGGDTHHSLTGVFDIDWDDVGSKVVNCVNGRTLIQRPSHDSSIAVASDDGEKTTTEAATATQPPQPRGSGSSAAAHCLALERLIHKLSEEDAKLIWLQFARYESEIGYLRSVIYAYEDICLAGNAGERHPQRTPGATGHNRPLSSNDSARRPRSALRFKEAVQRGEICLRAAGSRSCSFNSSASRRRRRAEHSAAVLLQANEALATAPPQFGSESTTPPDFEGSDGQCLGEAQVASFEDPSAVSRLQPVPAA